MYERLEKTQARRIKLVVPTQTQMRSHVSWRLLHSRAREQGKDVLVISPDRQIRSVAKAAGFKVDDSLETPSTGKSRLGSRPSRAGLGGKTSAHLRTPPGRASRADENDLGIIPAPAQSEAGSDAEPEGLNVRLVMPQAQVPPVASAPPPSSLLTQQIPDQTCPNCKQTVPAGASFCATCGFSLSPSAVLQTRITPLPALEPHSIPPASPVSLQQPPASPEKQVQNSSQEIEEIPNRVGHRLGNYQLVRLLGEGGFAEVYLGEHIHLGNQAAIKVLHGQLTSAEREQFRQEARTLVRLIHPHIVRVLDFGIEDKTPFLVMDYAANGTLRARHPKGTRLPLATIITYVKQVADALQFAHDQKIIHRDIKPENMWNWPDFSESSKRAIVLKCTFLFPIGCSNGASPKGERNCSVFALQIWPGCSSQSLLKWVKTNARWTTI